MKQLFMLAVVFLQTLNVFSQVGGVGTTVPGGENNQAYGQDSFAAGKSAQALHDRSFVWSDGSLAFLSTAPNQFLIAASGGVGIGLNHPQAALDVNGSIKAKGVTTIGLTSRGPI